VNFDANTELPVMETFYTVQGEGAHSGRPAYFIRLAGCDVGCHWCDVKESWAASNAQLRPIQSLIDEVVASGANFAVITGGEPLMYNLDSLTTQLKSAGIELAVETSGAHPLSGTWDWICFSPKKFKAPREEFYAVSHELKTVVYNKSDLKWGEDHAANMHDKCILYLQPEWDRRDLATPLILNYIRENPKWRISVQSHKYIGIP
jgi:7-carboxy-7-deazaguanine synthase